MKLDKVAGHAITLLCVLNLGLTAYMRDEYNAARADFLEIPFPLIGWAIMVIQILACLVAAQWIRQSKRIGFGLLVIVQAISLVHPRTSGGEYRLSGAMENLWFFVYFGNLVCLVHSFLRLTGCYGEIPKN